MNPIWIVFYVFIFVFFFQALFQLLEPNVVLRCRQKDIPLVQEVVPDCLRQLKSQANRDCRLEIDRSGFLAPDSAGGVELFSQDGKIRVISTLESRLELISQNVRQMQIYQTNSWRRGNLRIACHNDLLFDC